MKSSIKMSILPLLVCLSLNGKALADSSVELPLSCEEKIEKLIEGSYSNHQVRGRGLNNVSETQGEGVWRSQLWGSAKKCADEIRGDCSAWDKVKGLYISCPHGSIVTEIKCTDRASRTGTCGIETTPDGRVFAFYDLFAHSPKRALKKNWHSKRSSWRIVTRSHRPRWLAVRCTPTTK